MGFSKYERIQLLEKIRKLTLAGEYDQALSDVDKVLANNPEDQDALGLKGNIMELMQRDDEARMYYEKVLELNPTNVQAWVDLGDNYSNNQNISKALEYYDGACSLIKQGVIYAARLNEVEQAYFAKASLLKTVGKLQEAIDCAQEGLRLAPESELLRDFH